MQRAFLITTRPFTERSEMPTKFSLLPPSGLAMASLPAGCALAFNLLICWVLLPILAVQSRFLPALREAPASNVHAAHPALGIAGAGGGADRDRRGDAVDLGRGRMHVERAEILLEPGNLVGAGDRDNVGSLRQQPGQSELRRGAALVLGDRFKALDEGAVLGEIITHKAGMPAAGVARVEMGEIGNGPGEQAAAERGIGDKSDAEIAGQPARLGRLLAVEQREFALHGGDRVDRVASADALRPGFAEAEKAHLALLDQPGHGADRVLYRSRRIDAMLVIEVDNLDAEPLEARLAGLLYVFRATIDAAGATVLAEFGREHDPVALPRGQRCKRTAEKFLVRA